MIFSEIIYNQAIEKLRFDAEFYKSVPKSKFSFRIGFL